MRNLIQVRDVVAKYAPEHLTSVSSPWGEWPHGQAYYELRNCLANLVARFDSWNCADNSQECKQAIEAIDREERERRLKK